MQQGLAARARTPLSLPPSLDADQRRVLQRYSRLLVMEEAAQEADCRRHDLHYARLSLALFDDRPDRYRQLPLPLTADRVAAAAAPTRAGAQRYRGPTLRALLPRGLPEAAEGHAPTWVLAVLRVPGLPEKRPAVTPGAIVYLRTAARLEREVAGVAAATEGDRALLLLPEAFWRAPDVAPLLARLGRPAGGSAQLEQQGPLFDGLVHARFSFPREPLLAMHAALQAAAVLHGRCCLVPPCDPQTLAALAPGAEAVAAAAAGLHERGPRRLNAEQRQAVAALVCGAGRGGPFALWGPPGTGKTVTVAEAALQLLAAWPSCRLLLAAPQPYSADLLCSALAAAGVPRREMLRLNPPQRPPYEARGLLRRRP